MKPNLDKLESLSDDQLKKISDDVDTIGIRKTAEQASKDTDRSIDKTCIQRLKERSSARRFLVESPDASQAASEILRFAVTGRPDFSEATIKVLEETAFKLSLDSAESEEDGMKALNSITVMLARYRTASVRDRMAKLQEDKLQLRREEFEWKKSLRGSAPVSGALFGVPPNHSVQSDHLGRLAKTLDDVERRACEMFNQPYDRPISGPHSSELAATGAVAPAINTGLQSGEPAATCNQTVSTVSSPSHSSPNSDASRPYLQSEKNS